MAITRTQYITVAELNEILGVSTYTSANEIDIKEASELLEYYMFDKNNSYDTLTAPDDLKLATAYQVLYMISNDNDNEYDASNEGFSIGKFSQNNSNGANGGIVNSDYKKISPKSRRYLFEGGLIKRAGTI